MWYLINVEIVVKNSFAIKKLNVKEDGKMYLKLKVNSKQLFTKEFRAFVAHCRIFEIVEQIELEMELNNKFDEWDIEKYVEAFRNINPDVIHIYIAKQDERPYYKQIKEVQGALEHFANVERIDIDEQQQVFKFNGIKIVFDTLFG